MSKRNNYIVHTFISTKKSLEEVEKRTLDRMKFKWRKNSAVSWITRVPDSYADEDDCANAAERALTRIEERFWDPLESGSEQGLLLAKDILQEELKKYHGE